MIGDNRPTPDLIVMILSAIVGFVIIFSVITITVVAIVNPDENLTTIFAKIIDVTNTLIGAIIGYVAGSKVKPNGGSR